MALKDFYSIRLPAKLSFFDKRINSRHRQGSRIKKYRNFEIAFSDQFEFSQPRDKQTSFPPHSAIHRPRSKTSCRAYQTRKNTKPKWPFRITARVFIRNSELHPRFNKLPTGVFINTSMSQCLIKFLNSCRWEIWTTTTIEARFYQTSHNTSLQKSVWPVSLPTDVSAKQILGSILSFCSHWIRGCKQQCRRFLHWSRWFPPLYSGAKHRRH